MPIVSRQNLGAAERQKDTLDVLRFYLHDDVSVKFAKQRIAQRHATLIKQWFTEYSLASERTPTVLRVAVQSAELICSLVGIYSNGTTVGTCRDQSTTFRVFAGFLLGGRAIGCECRESRGKSACRHTTAFLSFLLENLANLDSELRRRVVDGDFDSGEPDYDSFKPSLYQLELDALDRVIEKRTRCIEPPADELSLRLDATTARVAWNFTLDEGRLLVKSWQQSQSSNKESWVKGRPLSLPIQWSPQLLFTGADMEVQRLAMIDTEETDPVAVALLLVQQSNALFEGKPIALSGIEILLELRRADERIAIRPVGWKPEHMLFLSDLGGIVIMPNEGLMHVFRLTREQSEIMRGLDWMRELPCDPYEPALLDRAKFLQTLLNLRLPDDVAGEVIPESIRIALLLRSHSDGQLDYGFRIRDSDGHLRRPGIGPSVRSSRIANRPVQWLRSSAAEHQAVADRASRLGLDSTQVEGKVETLDESLRLIEALQVLENDMELLWEKGAETRLVMAGTLKTENLRVEVIQKRDWFQLEGSCKLGEESIAIAKLMESLSNPSLHSELGEYIRIEEVGWIRVAEHLRMVLQRLRDQLNEQDGSLQFDDTSTAGLRSLQDEVTIEPSQAWQNCLSRLNDAELLDPVLPVGLQASLRSYQLEGFKWLRRLAELGTGAILADDMGLGKTVQTLALVLDRASLGPTLVIAPTSVGFNWMRETTKFAPGLETILYRESERSEVLESAAANQVVVCTYGLALRDAEKLEKVQWATMVLDEAQAIKNSRGKTSQAIRKFKASWSVALTGTPVENHLGELWSIFHVVAPGLLGSWPQFRLRFAGPIENHNDEQRRYALRQRIQPFVLRRTKQEVLKDLPSRTEMNVYVVLSEPERAIYDRIRLSILGEVDKVAKIPDITDLRFKLLALITRLRQVACHPGLVHESWLEPSAKLIQLRETLLELREEGHRVLIFSQFTKHLALIRAMLDSEGISYQYLDGSTPAEERQVQVDQFQNGDAIAFLISLKAGGTGLNLTAADYVIHMDPWWNPAVENQATDRAHRIGQMRPVMVYRIIAKDTIEEEILKLHETKRDLASAVLSGAESAGKLSTADLMKLIRGQ